MREFGFSSRTLYNPLRKNSRTRSRKTRNLEFLESRQLLAGDLIAHWSADDIQGIEDGASLAAWTDLVSGVSLEAANASQPTLVRNAVGGRSMLEFNGSESDSLQADPSDSPMSDIGDFSIAVSFATDSNMHLGQNATQAWFENSGLVDGNSLGLANDWGISINLG